MEGCLNTKCAVTVAVSVCLVFTMACNSDTPVSPVSPTPSKHIVSGVIFEATPNAPTPLAGVRLLVDSCFRDNPNEGAHTVARSDAAGAYLAADVCAGVVYIWVDAPAGYTTRRPYVGCDGDCFKLTVDGDTHFDIELVRQ